MLAFPEMLVSAAEDAGMKIPEGDKSNFSSDEFPHWHVFLALQLGVAMYPGEHFNNAKVIASISDEEIKKVTIDDLLEAGYHSKAL